MCKTNNAVDVSVGDNVRSYRMRLGLGTSFVAEKLGIPLAEFQDCERGVSRFGPEHLLKLGRLMNINPGYFFGAISADEQASPH
jgi:hypothetical protein